MLIEEQLNTLWNRRNIFEIAAVLLFAVGSAGCMGSSSASSGGPPPPLVPGAVFAFCDDGGPDCTPATSFSVASVRDVVIKVSWDNLPAGNHVQTLEIMIPGGGLYQATQTAFLMDGSSSGLFTATRVLPVAGTWIQQRQMTGDWLVRVSLDDQVVASHVVTLNP
jgi:hypothetical protein